MPKHLVLKTHEAWIDRKKREGKENVMEEKRQKTSKEKAMEMNFAMGMDDKITFTESREMFIFLKKQQWQSITSVTKKIPHLF